MPLNLKTDEKLQIEYLTEGGLRLSHVCAKADLAYNQQIRDSQDLLMLNVGGVEFSSDSPKPAEKIAAEYISVIKGLNELYLNAKVIVNSILPRRQSLDSVINTNIQKVNVVLSSECSKMPGVVMIDTWSSFCDEKTVIPDLFLEESEKDDVHISIGGKFVLGQLWADSILSNL